MVILEIRFFHTTGSVGDYYWIEPSALNFEGTISLEMVKNYICLVGASK